MRKLKLLAILFSILSSGNNCKAGAEEEDALQHLSSAIYQQLELEEKINKIIEQEMPKEYIEFATKISPIVKIIATKRMDMKWTF